MMWRLYGPAKEDNEMEINEKGIAANYFRGPEAVGGKLYFDEQGLTFKPHSLNIQKEQLRLRFADMQDVRPRKTWGLIPNGLAVFTRDGTEHKFVVYHPKELTEYIRSRI